MSAALRIDVDELAHASTCTRPRARAGVRKLASGFSPSRWEIASGLGALQPANDTGETSACAYDFVSESLIWLSKDPIGLRGGLNLYGYVNDDPVNFIDGAGQQTIPAPAVAPLAGAAGFSTALPGLGILAVVADCVFFNCGHVKDLGDKLLGPPKPSPNPFDTAANDNDKAPESGVCPTHEGRLNCEARAKALEEFLRRQGGKTQAEIMELVAAFLKACLEGPPNPFGP